MTLDRQAVEQLAHLARLRLDDDELLDVIAKLSGIVEFVDQLARVETGGVLPLAHPLEMTQRLRPDEVTETDGRDRLQQNADQVSDGLYLVPRVIE
ncbi:MAG: Asp-tRNA(Asn)/Glu-tRNA(Gln) amidotransferase subunit GatC [Chromatiales bacterium]|nr:Asp-tRNA(Asn)/Glu-tRNA(Gln) amidotransferase subunit GatC [Chromatiales bacterium]